MAKFIITSPQFTGEIELVYNDDGYLIKYDNRSEMDRTQIDYLLCRFPVHSALLQSLFSKSKSLVTEVSEDLSFDLFWNKYSYKIGNKKRCEKLWELLTDKEKHDCLAAIRKYDTYLSQRPKMDKAYPETFLNQKRWENDYR